ncbi:MAG: tyrosine-type recombinase/integrase [Candidatus Cryptobacteroides sp.]
MDLIDSFIEYIGGIKRYSERTVRIYSDILKDFHDYLEGEELLPSLCPSVLRSYEVHLLEEKKLSPRTVGQYLSVLSSFCKYLYKKGLLSSNPLRSISRLKTEKSLPIFYRQESMLSYFKSTAFYASEEALGLVEGKGAGKAYEKILGRLIISILFYSGIRRSELIGLRYSDLDPRRSLLRVRGKGDKEREIPLEDSLIREISLYLQAGRKLGLKDRMPQDPLLLCPSGIPLYPEYVDRAVKRELGSEESITCRKSPHVLRHTIATELLNDGAQLNSIKEMLGHSSLAATQVYTHNSIEKLKKTYNQAHPLCRNSKK